MSEDPAERPQREAFTRVDQVPGFSTLSVYEQCDFLRRHHMALARGLMAHGSAENAADREKALEQFREAAHNVRAEAVRAILSRNASIAVLANGEQSNLAST